MKLRQNGTVSFLIRLADFQARGVARVKLAKGKVSFSIGSAVFLAGGWLNPEPLNHKPFDFTSLLCSDRT